MKTWQLWVVGVLYLWVAYDYYVAKDVGMFIAFIAYCLANAGFIYKTIYG